MRFTNVADRNLNSLGWNPPVSGFVYANFFDGDDVLSRNMIPDQPVVTLTGAPTLHEDGYAVFESQSDFLQTRFAETSQLTLVSVSRGAGVTSTTSTRPMFISNFEEGDLTRGGTSLLVSSATQLQGISLVSNAGTPGYPTATILSDPNEWSIKFVTVDASNITVHDWTNDVSASSPLTYARALGSNKFRIGSSYNTGWQGVSHHHFAGIMSVAADATARDAIGRVLRRAAAAAGISV